MIDARKAQESAATTLFRLDRSLPYPDGDKLNAHPHTPAFRQPHGAPIHPNNKCVG